MMLRRSKTTPTLVLLSHLAEDGIEDGRKVGRSFPLSIVDWKDCKRWALVERTKIKLRIRLADQQEEDICGEEGGG
jgi:hypothetical protein